MFPYYFLLMSVYEEERKCEYMLGGMGGWGEGGVVLALREHLCTYVGSGHLLNGDRYVSLFFTSSFCSFCV